MRRRHPSPFANGVIASLAVVAGVAAQCEPQLRAELPVGGVDRALWATRRWDPDGAGPRGEVVVLAGQFEAAGGIAANNIATWDPATGAFAPLGLGLGATLVDSVRALAVSASGELLAGGVFHQSGATALDNLARWTGSAWVPFGVGSAPMTGVVNALAVLQNGDVVVGGTMLVHAPAASIDHLARWTGAQYAAMGGAPDRGVHALALTPANELVAAGDFTSIGGVTALHRVARWTGSTWAAYGAGIGGFATASVRAVAPLANGDLVVGGFFTTAGAVTALNVAHWSNNAWTTIGPGINAMVVALTELSGGDVVAAVAAQAPRLQRWNGSQWTVAGTALGVEIRTLTVLPNDSFVAGGQFGVIDGVGAANVVRWDGTAFVPLAVGAAGTVWASAQLRNGDVVVGGDFDAMAVPARNLAQRTVAGWSDVGGGTDGTVFALTVLPDGRLIAGGRFDLAGSIPARNVAAWDGTSWAPLGAGVGSVVELVSALATLPNGELVAGGWFQLGGSGNHLARWNGTAWLPLGTPNLSVSALQVLPDGDLLVGGGFSWIGPLAANLAARWNGTTWTPMGAGLSGYVFDFALGPDGELFAAAGARVHRWDGSAWTTVGITNGSVRAVVVLPGGDVIAGGDFTDVDTVTVPRLARWRASGAGWVAVGAGTNVGPASIGVGELTRLPDGRVLAGGGFSIAGDVGAGGLLWVRSPCAATSLVRGVGCVGLVGPNALAAVSQPWLGATWRALASGSPANAIVVRLVGAVAVATPLAALTPLGGAGCTLLTSPDLVDAFVAASGTLALELPIPNAPTLIGGTFHEQVVVAEVDASGAITRFTSSNAVTATIGSW